MRASYITNKVLGSGDPAKNRADKAPPLIEEKHTREEINQKIAGGQVYQVEIWVNSNRN